VADGDGVVVADEHLAYDEAQHALLFVDVSWSSRSAGRVRNCSRVSASLR
jgi:hypothetical protein